MATLTPEQLEKDTKLKHLNSAMIRVKAELDNLDGEVVKSVALAKEATPTTGYAATYTLSVNGAPLAQKIDVPKDWLLTGVTKGVVTAADKAAGGKFENDTDFAVGDKYIDFEFNVKAGGAETSTHIYLNVNDLVDVYTAGAGLTENNNEFSVAIDAANANGLSASANGVALAAATASTSGAGGSNGAMLATDKEKLNGVSAEANKVTVTTPKAGTIEIDGVQRTIVEFATDQEVSDMLDEVFGTQQSGG